jgi:hypothetical protein
MFLNISWCGWRQFRHIELGATLSYKLDEQLLSVPLHTGRADNNRTRGDSISSMSTNRSTVPLMTSSSTSSASKSSVNPTPGSDETYPIVPTAKPHESTFPESAMSVDDHTISPYRMHLIPRRPLDIDIRSISSHAQAEALVQRAQHAIMDMTDELTVMPYPVQDRARAKRR